MIGYLYFVVWHLSCLVFFFQAEDGIRDLVRSRGLGDVYKRQSFSLIFATLELPTEDFSFFIFSFSLFTFNQLSVAVSYTHLTLPTSDLV